MKKMLNYLLSTLFGAVIIGLGYALIGNLLSFVLGMFDPPEPEVTTKLEESVPTASTSTRKIVGYTANDEPIYEDQIYIPEPTQFDEYGIKYNLVEGTIDEYYIDEEYQEVIDTPDSDAFTEISYWPFFSELRVRFRNSGICYIYYDVDPEIWCHFKNADSKGSFFNECIKGKYEYERD